MRDKLQELIIEEQESLIKRLQHYNAADDGKDVLGYIDGKNDLVNKLIKLLEANK